MQRPHRRSVLLVSAIALSLGGCAIAGGVGDPLAEQAQLTPDTKSGVVLDSIPPPAQPLDVAVYSFPDLTGQNKENDSFAEFSRAITQGAAPILIDVLTRAGGGQWFNVVERTELNSLIQERQIIQNTRSALYGKGAEALPALRFAGVELNGGIVGYDTNDMTGGAGANWLGVGGFAQYRRDVVTVALRAVSVQTGRVLASVTTTQIVYSIQAQGSAFKYQAVNELLQVEGGFTRNQPATIAVREGIQLAVYALIFEGARHNLWTFKNPAAGAAFMKTLDETGRANIPTADAGQSASPASAAPAPQVASAAPAKPSSATAAVAPALAPKTSPTATTTPASASPTPAAFHPQAAAPPAPHPADAVDSGASDASPPPSPQPMGRGGVSASSASPGPEAVSGATVASADTGIY
jgi:curli production assembly/transport component CsgG